MNCFSRLCAVTALSLTVISPSLADDCKSVYDDETNPSFRNIFTLLNERKQQYNNLNDSLYLEENETDWVKFIYRRSETNYNNYIDNQEKINDIIYYFLEPMPNGRDATSCEPVLRKVPDVAYDSLWAALDTYYRLSDPFITEIMVGKILIPYYSNKSNIDEAHQLLLSHLYLNYGDALYQIYCMGDKGARRKSYDCLKLAMKFGSMSGRNENSIYGFYALSFILSNRDLIDVGRERGEDIMLLHHVYSTYYLRYHDELSRNYLWSYYTTMINLSFNYKYVSLRSLIQETSSDDEVGIAEIERQLADVRDDDPVRIFGKKNLYFDEYYASDVLFMACKGQISYKRAFDLCWSHYTSFLPVTSLSTFNRSFRCYTTVARTMLYLLDKTDYPRSQKEDYACKMMDNVLKLLNQRPKKSVDTRHTTFLMSFIKDKRFLKYLPAGKRIPYIKECAKVLSVHTLVHCELVEDYSCIMLDAIYEQCPEQLIGVLGTTTLEEVMARKDEIKTTLRVGCQFHDVGKLQIEQIVNNEFRRLTDHEFEIIKTHAENSAYILSLDTAFGQFNKYALGHHKWYDGTKGYPIWYDNTKYQDRILVDILTIADCLEAATNFMSRNYRRSKPYETLIQEFKEGAGTRYNPFVVDAIIKSEKYHRLLGEEIAESKSIMYKNVFNSNIEN